MYTQNCDVTQNLLVIRVKLLNMKLVLLLTLIVFEAACCEWTSGQLRFTDYKAYMNLQLEIAKILT